jgi:ABC-type nitrate/sulfonate/bicarbonate transport system substrate-binding protein
VYTAFDNVLAWSGREGAEIIAVAQLDRETTLPVYVRPEITDWPDLRGKPLAVDAADTAFALVLRRILLAHGLDLLQGDYTLVPLGATAARNASMTSGDTFAGIINAPINRQAEAAGMVFFGDQREVLPDYPGSVIAVRRDWAAENRDVLIRFLRAWRQAGEFSQTERDQAGAIFGRETNQPAATAVGLLPTAFDHGMINLGGLQTVLDLRNQFGYALPMGPNLAAYVDQSFWSAAAAAK